MRKDFKIGMLLGLGLAVIVVLWLSSRERFSIQSQVLHSAQDNFAEQPMTSEVRYTAPLPGSTSMDSQFIASSRESQNNTSYEQPYRNENIETQQRIHVVSKGETLSSISYQYYGSSNEWPKIFNANRNKLKNPNVVLPGTKLIIPDQ
jgi:nucleoid-associated protein YgaU